MTARRLTLALSTTLLAALLLTGCVAGEGSQQAAPAATGSQGWSDNELSIDFATYNPLSLIIKEKGWLEEEFGDDVTVVWTQSAGSNKANEGLRAHAIDVGSTAGSAALLARANGSPIKTILLYSQPEWSALVAPAGSEIDEVEDLRGKSVAATKGTDPYFFLLQALAEHGLTLDDIEVQNLQHGDAWSGLDPLMAVSAQDAGSTLFYRNIDFNTYGFLNATEDFLETNPDLAQAVVDAYERARAWAQDNPEETVEILAEVAAIDPAIAQEVLVDRTVLDLDPVPGPVQTEVLSLVGAIFVESGDVPNQEVVDEALTSLYDPSFVNAALGESAGG